MCVLNEQDDSNPWHIGKLDIRRNEITAHGFDDIQEQEKKKNKKAVEGKAKDELMELPEDQDILKLELDLIKNNVQLRNSPRSTVKQKNKDVKIENFARIGLDSCWAPLHHPHGTWTRRQPQWASTNEKLSIHY